MLQFEKGQIGFRQDEDGDWSAVNIDLYDEAEAFKTSLEVADPADMSLDVLDIFKRKYDAGGVEQAAQRLRDLYPGLSIEHKNNTDMMNLKMIKKF